MFSVLCGSIVVSMLRYYENFNGEANCTRSFCSFYDFLTKIDILCWFIKSKYKNYISESKTWMNGVAFVIIVRIFWNTFLFRSFLWNTVRRWSCLYDSAPDCCGCRYCGCRRGLGDGQGPLLFDMSQVVFTVVVPTTAYDRYTLLCPAKSWVRCLWKNVSFKE